jgi:hypothetical protein
MYCNFCKNKSRDWIEDNFYGTGCTPCGSAYITCIEHKKLLTEEEKTKVYELIKKYYPGFEVLGFGTKNLGRVMHWFEAVKKNE